MKNLTLSVLIALFLSAAKPVSGAVKVIVLPLENLSRAASLRWLSDGIAIAVSEQLSMPDVAVIGRERRARLAEALDLPPNSPLSRASMIRVAQEAGAEYLVMGSYSGTSDKIQITLRILSMKTLKLGEKLLSSGPMSNIPQLENELAWKVLSSVGVVQNLSRDDFKRRIRTVPNTAYSLYIRSLGVASEDEQMKLIARAVEAYPEFSEAQYILGRYHFQRGDCAKAVLHLGNSLKGERHYTAAEFMLGTCYLKQDAQADAVQAYSNLLSFARPYEALNNLAVAYLRKGEYPLAIENLLEAIKLAPGNLTIELNLALLRHLQGNDRAARETLLQSILSHPNIGMLNYLLCLVSNALGDATAAEDALVQAKRLGIDPEKLQSQDPKSWARVFPTWEPQP